MRQQSAELSRIGVAAVVAFVALLIAGYLSGERKVLVVSVVAFIAMVGFAIPGARARGVQNARRLVWGYGLAAGAMVMSASLFLLPQAFNLGGRLGGLGVAAGLLVGYGAHTISHRLSHVNSFFDRTVVQITAHALSAGLVIGTIYAALPNLGYLLGLSIVSHKGPAGYAAARRLAGDGRPVSGLLLPATAIGLAAIPVAIIDPVFSTATKAVLFGFGAGIFLHVAMDFLPECETGTEVGEVAQLSDDAHALLDRLRVHAVLSTATGAGLVVAAWLLTP